MSAAITISRDKLTLGECCQQVLSYGASMDRLYKLARIFSRVPGVRRIRRIFALDPNRFLRRVSGVVHVGANTGQESELYQKLGLRVLWIEPIPSVFNELKSNIDKFPLQKAVQALVTDRDGAVYEFNIASNEGCSSSIFDLKDHKEMHPDVRYVDKISLTSKTLATILKEQSVSTSTYDALVMDTQGSELLVLKGAEPLLKHFKFIKTEVANFESYAGCCQLSDIDGFMKQHGFRRFASTKLGRHPSGGQYFEMIYKRRQWIQSTSSVATIDYKHNMETRFLNADFRKKLVSFIHRGLQVISTGEPVFGSNAVDVKFLYTIQSPEGLRLSCTFLIGIVPSIADDVTSVFRRLKDSNADVLFLGAYRGSEINEQQFVKMFLSEGIAVVFERDIDLLKSSEGQL